MEDIIKEIGNPAWWFTVIIAGFAISFTAGLANKKYEKYRGKQNEKNNLEESEKAKKREFVINSLLNNPNGLIMYRLQATSHKIDAVRAFVSGLIIILFFNSISDIWSGYWFLITIPFYILGASFLILGVEYSYNGVEQEAIVSEVLHRMGKEEETT